MRTASNGKKKAIPAEQRRILNDKDKLFIDRYFESGNIQSAYKEVFGDYSYHRAISILDSKLGSARMKELAKKHEKTFNVSASKVMMKYEAMANTVISDIFDLEKGEIKQDIDRTTMLMVKSIKVKETFGKDGDSTRTTEISLYDRPAVLRDQAKLIGMFTENIDVNVTVSVKDQIRSVEVRDGDVQNLLDAYRQKREYDGSMLPQVIDAVVADEN